MLNSRKAYSYFDNKLGLKKSTKNWWSFHCPYCGKTDRKGAVHFDFEIVKCWTCQYRKMITDWVSEFERVDFDTAEAIINSCTDADVNLSDLFYIRSSQEVAISFPTGYTPLNRIEGIMGKRAIDYLSGRGLDIDYLLRMQIGYCIDVNTEPKENYFGYIILPFMVDYKLRYYIGRDYIGNFLRYKNPDAERCGIGKSELLFNSQALDKYPNTMLVEGLFCALTMGDECMASMGKDLSPYQVSKIVNSPCKGVYICLDAGAQEKIAALKMASVLIDHKKVHIMDLSLIASDKKKDPNELGKEAVAYLAKHTPPVTRLDILKSYLN